MDKESRQILNGIAKLPTEKPKSSTGLSVQLQNAITGVKERYGAAADFLVTFNKDRQKQAAMHPDRVYLGTAPSLAVVRAAYNSEVLTTWIMAQLEDINDFSGVAAKMSIEQMVQVAGIVESEYYYLKVSELLLFFHRFKAGAYGQFYGAVDPLIITLGLAAFAGERNHEIRMYQRQVDERQADLKRSEWAKTAVTRAQYEQMKQDHCQSTDRL